MKDVLRAAAWPLVRLFARIEEKLRGGTVQPKTAVLIHSFDGYKRFWKPSGYFANENLPEAVDVFFATENQVFDAGRLIPLSTGSGSYASRLWRAVKAVERRGYKYVLYLQEDMWITRPIEAELIRSLTGLMEKQELDCVKLGPQPFPEDHEEIRRTAGRVGAIEGGASFRWFGPHRYAFSHHPSIFRARFLVEMAYASWLFGRTEPLAQERFCSAYLKPRVVNQDGDGNRYRIAVFEGEPLIEYLHASASGDLTDQAKSILDEYRIADYYDPGLEGEVFPETG